MYRTFMAFAAIAMMSLMATSQDNTESSDDQGSTEQVPIGYFLGFSVGQSLYGQGVKADDIEMDSFVAGLSDSLADKEIQYSDEQLQDVAGRLQKLINDRMTERLAAKRAEGEKWLAENLKKEGVKELTGGLQYKVLKEGDGASPGPSDNVRVHYTGKLTNGQVFDSSVQRGQPAEFVVGQVIKGWQMALQKMQVGDKWMLYIPSEMAYGERGSRPAIGPNEVLVFEVELLGIL